MGRGWFKTQGMKGETGFSAWEWSMLVKTTRLKYSNLSYPNLDRHYCQGLVFPLLPVDKAPISSVRQYRVTRVTRVTSSG